MSGEHEPAPLDAEALAMLSAYRAEERPADDVRARVWQRLEGAEPAPVAAPAPSKVRALRWAIVAVAAAAGIVLAVAGVRSSVLQEDDDPTRHPEAALQHEARESGGTVDVRTPETASPRRRRATPAPTPAPLEPAPLDEVEVPDPPEAPKAAPRRKPTPAPSEPEPALAAETKLLKRARASLTSGDTARCLAALAEHTRRFPSGVLAEEREALRAIALCTGDSDDGGTAAARTFSAKYPASPLLPRVRSACAE
jgi:hypothetical protein